jgi:hypothetical protein
MKNALITLVIVAFVGIVILGMAYGMTHNVGVNVNMTATVNNVCSVAQLLCTSK